MKLEVSISSFMYFRTVTAKKQIRSYVFWENLWRANLLSVLSDLYNGVFLYVLINACVEISVKPQNFCVTLDVYLLLFFSGDHPHSE